MEGRGEAESVGINLPEVKVDVNAAEMSSGVGEGDVEGKTAISWMISARSSDVLPFDVDGGGEGEVRHSGLVTSLPIQ